MHPCHVSRILLSKLMHENDHAIMILGFSEFAYSRYHPNCYCLLVLQSLLTPIIPVLPIDFSRYILPSHPSTNPRAHAPNEPSPQPPVQQSLAHAIHFAHPKRRNSPYHPRRARIASFQISHLRASCPCSHPNVAPSCPPVSSPGPSVKPALFAS